jgi:hypothetical protein
MAEPSGGMGSEQDGLSADRESRRPQGRTNSLKYWYSFEIAIADAEGFHTEGNTEASDLKGILRSWFVSIYELRTTPALRCYGSLPLLAD